MVYLGIVLIAAAAIVMISLAVKAAGSVKRSKGIAGGDNELKAFGYKQELLRDMGGFSNFAISFSIISVLTGAVTLYGFGFNQGGPAVMGLGWPLVTLFVLFIAASLSEMTSAIPTSGAIYHWTSILGGKGWGWFSAWFNLVGQVTVLAGIDYGCAGFASSLIYGEPTKGQTLTIYAVILLSHALINHFGIRAVAKMNDISALYHVIGVGIIIGALAYFGPEQNVSYLFDTSFSGATTSTSPYWFCFLVGLLQAQWTYTGYDASAHTSEETVDAKIRSPWGVYLSVALSGVFGFLMIALVTISIKDPSAVAAAGGNGFIVAIEQAIGGAFGRAVLWMVTAAMWFCGLSSLTSVSRMMFAFARDGGLPLSRIFSKVSKRFRTPAPAIWIGALIAFLCVLAANVYALVTSLSVISLYASYGMPILLRLYARFKGVWTDKDNGPWSLGKWSTAVNFISVAWIAFVTVLFVISPSDVAWSDTYTLHYATGKVFAGVVVLLVIYYTLYARRSFAGPHLGSYREMRERMANRPISLPAAEGPVLSPDSAI
ncbi:amino acid permease [Gorillibacterium massiliense]|uniref:amino acid permease n=1 Tax=Gorillibacterium massiliense TaxID=1280390 RepID=UPI0004B8AEC1|nr:amino acid permease [Gorillibacterium massiliense]